MTPALALAVLLASTPALCAQSASPSPATTFSMLVLRRGVLSPPVGARTGEQVYAAECAQCHGEIGNGKGTAYPFLTAKPRDFTRKKYKLRATGSGELPTRDDLLATVTRGIRPHAMPAFDFLPEPERKAVVERVLAFSGAAGKPDPQTLPVPPLPAATPEVLAAGQAAYETVQCGKCHQPNAEDAQRPDLTDEAGEPVHPPHLRFEEFIGPDGAGAIYTRLRTGMDGTSMPSFAGAVSDEDLQSMALWIKSQREPRDPLPFLNRSRDPVIRAAQLVDRYRCKSCHVVNGEGGNAGPSIDLSGTKLRVEWIRAWLTDPRAHGKVFNDKYFRMPNLHLPAREVEDLTAYVLSRGQRSPRAPAPYIEPIDDAKLKAGETRYRVMCTRCHALGDVIPASVPDPSGPDLIRMVERLYYPWLQAAIISEGTTPQQAIEIRDFLWKVCTEKGPPPPAAPRAP